MTEPLLDTLLATARALEDRLDATLAAEGLSRPKLVVLEHLAEAGPLTLSALAQRQGCVASNMTTLVERLERSGLVRRVPDRADRRVVRVELTAAGAKQAAAGADAVSVIQYEVSVALPWAEQAAMRRALAALVAGS